MSATPATTRASPIGTANQVETELPQLGLPVMLALKRPITIKEEPMFKIGQAVAIAEGEDGQFQNKPDILRGRFANYMEDGYIAVRQRGGNVLVVAQSRVLPITTDSAGVEYVELPSGYLEELIQTDGDTVPVETRTELFDSEDSDCDFYASNYWRECTTHSDCKEQVCGDCGDIEQCETLPK
jgi:hypothetical protein